MKQKKSIEQMNKEFNSLSKNEQNKLIHKIKSQLTNNERSVLKTIKRLMGE